MSAFGRPQHRRNPPSHQRPATCRRHSARSSFQLVAVEAHPSSRGKALSLAAPPTTKLCVDSTVVLGSVWLPGFGAALSSVGFGTIAAFSSLLFVDHGWTPVWLAFSAYAASLIVARVLFGHLPDRVGGARVALWFVLMEAAGLALMFLAATTALATIGAALTGFGFSLVFPALGVEAVRRAPPESRGVAMGAYTACLDIALGVSG
ncbi:MAG: MFS transporter, partial [Acetobacteraceae bacterium]|nr:MFS transporter [Acetobacteraceae bacterium]